MAQYVTAVYIRNVQCLLKHSLKNYHKTFELGEEPCNLDLDAACFRAQQFLRCTNQRDVNTLLRFGLRQNENILNVLAGL